jgi:hypothetical protein
VPDKTRRWFADSNVSYALAAIALFEHARDSRVRYAFGPLTAREMADGGLSVSGSPAALEQAAMVLEAIPGLAEYDPD